MNTERRESQRYSLELSVALQVAKKASDIIRAEINNPVAERHGLEFKAEVDRKANAGIVGMLSKSFPRDTILTEEVDIPERQSDRLWIVDPLDGTTNFLNGSRNYSVLIGLVEKGKLAMGVSLLPATDEIFHAVEGDGAYRNGELIHTSGVDKVKRATIALDPGYDPEGGEKVANLFQKLRPQSGNVAMYNANGYTLSMLAKGELGGFVHFSSKIWEAAGFLLVKEAGGKVTDLKGNALQLDFLSGEGFPFVASNGRIHDELIEAINKK